MVEWVYRRAGKAFDIVFVATDDEHIADEVKKFGGRVVMTSPDHPSGTDRCAEALDIIQEQLGEKADVVVNIQGDEPFVEPDLLKQLSLCFEDPEIQIATVARVFDNSYDLFNPNCVKTLMTKTGRAIYFSRSPIPHMRHYTEQEWLKHHTFFLHMGLYAYRADILRELTKLPPSSLEIGESLEQNRWLENEYYIKIIRTDYKSISIDTPEDLILAQQWIDKRHISL
jgi:3-deoxy-manno-octulosonate cytidylyltransferase (CMP-KDO synthetase)